MAQDAPALTTTDKNLWSAIVAEAMANLTYNAFAHKALEEGHPEVAQVFQEVAGAETIHGLNHLRVANGVGPTLENLHTVVTGEAKEFSTVYPRMINEALAEGRQDVADSFALALGRERHHLEMFSRALAELEVKQAATTAQPRRSPVELDEPGAAVESSEGPGDNGRPALATGFDTFVSAAMELDRERWRVASLGRLREVVFGAQDGILSTVALVTSVAVALDSQTAVLVAGLAAAAAGMISMATGAWLGSRAELDVKRAEIEREALELEEKPGEEFAELVVAFQREGKSYEEAREMADEIAQDKDLWLRTMAEKELGISMEETTSPVKDAAVMGVSFILAALVPIVPHMLLTGYLAISVSVGAALAGLFALGSIKGRLVRKSPVLQGLEILGIGAVSAAIGFGLGDGIPRLIG